MNQLLQLKTGLIFALLTILFGYGLGIFFGAAEDTLKGDLKAKGAAALESAYQGDEAAMKKVVGKSWSYYKRAHLHAGAIGTTAVAMILVMSAVGCVSLCWRKITAIALGVGGLGYSVYWLLAALRAPGMGSTHDAKESLDWLAIPSAAMCLLGAVSVLVMVVVARAKTDKG